MIDRLLVNETAREMRIALCHGEQLIEIIHQHPGAESLLGNIYLGRVTGLLAGANGAFVDLGEAASGFLNAADARAHDRDPVEAIGRYVDEGAAVLVQVSRDGLPGKGPRLTMRPSLVGRFVVFHPGRGVIEASRRIVDKAQRSRLIKLVEGTAQDDEGYILRSAAADADDGQILSDLAALRDSWGETLARRQGSSAPTRLWRAPEPLLRCLMDHPGLGRVIVDQGKTLTRLRAFMAGRDGVEFEHYIGKQPLFEHCAVAEALEEASEPRLALASGGAVIFQETEALCAIDVDGGGAAQAALRINFEAVAVIARQLRLRSIGGIIVIDFLRMAKRDHRSQIIKAMVMALTDDRDAVPPEGFSKLGLVEMRRRRKGPSLSNRLTMGGAGV